MPLVMIHLLAGRTDRAKRTLLKSVTDAVSTSLGVAPESVRVILNEVPAEHWAVGGAPIRAPRRARAHGTRRSHAG
ncbi:MAG TPA: 2-hydroxymuconate tautomerase [Candidatus Aminicenantes bacterium]|nr:2-hydroxymuconate tautomerase [Candidatus Aminicenantes bacterium]